MKIRAPERCTHCQQNVQADDVFCEACGQPVGQLGTVGSLDHGELDLGMAAGVTDRGLHHRRNEDAFYLASTPGGLSVAVSDGVSTSSHPHLASRAAADAAGQELTEALLKRESDPSEAWDPNEVTSRALEAAQEAVVRVPRRQETRSDAPSCTLASAIWDGESITVGWAGDSRAYWVGSDGTVQLTSDNSWAQERANAEGSDAPLRLDDPRAHAITRWLGSDAPFGASQVTTFRPMEEGKLILCSDGLWNYASTPADFSRLIHAHPSDLSPLELAQALVVYALESGGHDNVTVVVANLHPQGPRRA